MTQGAIPFVGIDRQVHVRRHELGIEMMSARTSKATTVWRQPDGKPVSCLEKIKVLNQNIQEIETLCADALEDGVLMGCDADQIKAALHELIDGLKALLQRQEVGVRVPSSFLCCSRAWRARPWPRRQPPPRPAPPQQPTSANVNPRPILRRTRQAGRRAAGPRQGDGAHPALLRAGRRIDALRHARHHRQRLPIDRPGGAAGIGRSFLDHRRQQAGAGGGEALCRLDVRLHAVAVGARLRGVYDVRVLSCTMAQGSSPPSSR